MTLLLLIALVFAAWLLLAVAGGVFLGRMIAFGQRPVRDHDAEIYGSGGARLARVVPMRPEAERLPRAEMSE